MREYARRILTERFQIDPNHPRLQGFQVRVPESKRQVRNRNITASILRYAKDPPPAPPLKHPVNGTIIPNRQATCHTCGRQFFHRPYSGGAFSHRFDKYCHRLCQTARPGGLDLWLERKVVKVLSKAYQVYRKKKPSFVFRVVPSDSIEDYIVRRAGRFQKCRPLHLTERVRRAARRLVGIPGRSGKRYQVVAFTKSKDPNAKGPQKFLLRLYAPDRGNILLGLRKMKDYKVERATILAEQNVLQKEVIGRRLQDAPGWKRKWYWDRSGRIRPSSDQRAKWEFNETDATTGLAGDPFLTTDWKKKEIEAREKTRMELRRYYRDLQPPLVGTPRPSWKHLLESNKPEIDRLAKQMWRDLGINVKEKVV